MRYVLILDDKNYRFKFKTMKEMFAFADKHFFFDSVTYEVYCN